MEWWRLIFENAKTHNVPLALRDPILKNLESRGCKLAGGEGLPKNWAFKKVTQGGVALGGARHVDDEVMYFELPGFSAGFYASDVDVYLQELRDLPQRHEVGRPYYKLHGDLHAICLIPEHRDMLLRLLEDRLPEALAIRDVEFQRWNEILVDLKKCSNLDPGGNREHRKIVEA